MKKILFASVLVATLASCKKEKFIGTQSFWYRENVSESLYYDGIDKLTLYVDGELISTIDSDTYYTATPDCKEGLFIYKDNMYRNEVASHTYKITDEFGDTVWEGTFTTKESLCDAIELVD